MRSNEAIPETKPMLNLSPEVLDQLLKDYKGPQDLIGDNGILQQLTKALVERCMSGELEHQLQEAALEESERPSKGKNRRNGYSKKTIKGKYIYVLNKNKDTINGCTGAIA